MKQQLELGGPKVQYGKRIILSDAYLSIQTGQINGLLGRNGSGKSTLMKLLFGSLRNENSWIRHQTNVLTKPAYRHTNLIQYLPQTTFLPGHLSIQTAIHWIVTNRAKAAALLQQYQLDHKQRCEILSEGQRRLFEASLLLNSETQFLLLDEPFTRLSPLQAEEMAALIKSKKDEKGILVSDHDYHAVIKISDTVTLLSNGVTRKMENEVDLIAAGYLPG